MELRHFGESSIHGALYPLPYFFFADFLVVFFLAAFFFTATVISPPIVVLFHVSHMKNLKKFFAFLRALTSFVFLSKKLQQK